MMKNSSVIGSPKFSMLFTIFISIILGTDSNPSTVREPTAVRLRVEYLDEPINIDTPYPRFSWALYHSVRGEFQTAYRIQVYRQSFDSLVPVWDSGKVSSNQTLNIPYPSTAVPLVSDADYLWNVTWYDSNDSASIDAQSTFSTALLSSPQDWLNSEYLSSTLVTAGDGGLNLYRSLPFTIPGTVYRARLYIIGQYYQTYINGILINHNILGPFNEYQARVYYDTVDITTFLQTGCNVIGIMLGTGWYARQSFMGPVTPKLFRLLVSVTLTNGTVLLYPSVLQNNQHNTDSFVTNLFFNVTLGPVLLDDIYIGEVYNNSIATRLNNWSTCSYPFASSPGWYPTVIPAVSPENYQVNISAHPVAIATGTNYTVITITEPAPNIYVFDFGQNMAGQVTLHLNDIDCPQGTVIKMKHAEILYPNGTVHNTYLILGTNMTGTYICSGSNTDIDYRYFFTYMGFRFVQLEGYPGIPTSNTLVAHFIHSNVERTGSIVSSSLLLNKIHNATMASLLSNLMDIPVDCPTRERHGWLGDAWIAYETSVYNVDHSSVYYRWLTKDIRDAQYYNSVTLPRNISGSLPNYVPFPLNPGNLTHHLDGDPGWVYAAFVMTTWFGSYYDDTRMEQTMFPVLEFAMEHMINITLANKGIFPFATWGDWSQYSPHGTSNLTLTADYPQFFYCLTLQRMIDLSIQLNYTNRIPYYQSLLDNAQQLYLDNYYDSQRNCFGNCTYVSNIYGLMIAYTTFTHNILPSPIHLAQIWNSTLQQFTNNLFPGGIITLKYILPLLDYFNQSSLGLKYILNTECPSLGYWINQNFTTLAEEYNMTLLNPGFYGVASYNHIMFGSPDSWYYTTLAGIHRQTNSRSWKNLWLAPPLYSSEIYTSIQYITSSISTPIGLIEVNWTAIVTTASDSVVPHPRNEEQNNQPIYTLNTTVPMNTYNTYVRVPLDRPIDTTVLIYESGNVIWQNNAYIPVPGNGITSGTVTDNGYSVTFALGGGTYTFLVTAP